MANDGMAISSPKKVVFKAMAIPLTKELGSENSNSGENVPKTLVSPKTVPNKPIRGAIDVTTSKINKPRSNRPTSSWINALSIFSSLA